jgi:electron transfer flavoprotein beta subunit
MKILVCVKQVPETESSIVIDTTNKRIQRDLINEWKMNQYDEAAVEEALQIKNAFPDTSIDIISVGPPRSEIAIRRAIGMGADSGIHIVTDNQGYRDPFAVASWIAAFARSYDLILAGMISEDAMQGLVGPLIAENLSFPWATAVIFERLSPEKNQVYVEREIEGGFREQLELNLPAVLTVQTGINQPRYPSLSNLLRANKTELVTVDAAKLEHPAERLEVVRLTYPQKLREGLFLEGSQQEKAEQLLKILDQKFFIQ